MLVESILGFLKSLKYRLSCFLLKYVTTAFAPTSFLIVFFSLFLDGEQCLNFRKIYGGQELCRNRVVVPARQTTKAGGIDSWGPKSFKILSQLFPAPMFNDDLCPKLCFIVFFSLFLDVEQCWNFITIYGGQEPARPPGYIGWRNRFLGSLKV